MLTFKHVTRSKCLSPFSLTSTTVSFFRKTLTLTHYTTTTSTSTPITPKAIALIFKEWFLLGKNPLFDKIYRILNTQHRQNVGFLSDSAFSQLGLRLTESFVLQVLNYARRFDHGVLPCLDFFAWAGKQPGFRHTPATFNAIYKILRKHKRSVLVDFLDDFRKQSCAYRVRFYNTLVMGYAIAGKPEYALHFFGRMRFQGLDLDAYTFHVLLNALVEGSSIDAVRVILRQIEARGFESGVTRAIMMKYYCRQKRFDYAEAYLRGLIGDGKELSVHIVGCFLHSLCKNEKFERAGKLVEELRELNVVPMEHVYGEYLRGLVRGERLGVALEFFKDKRYSEGYVPGVFRYNLLIHKLLKQNQLDDAYDVLGDMIENQVIPDKFTLSAVICFFCKAGMVDAALEMYNARADIGLSLNAMAYNYLINMLCGDGSIDEAYHVLKTSIGRNYFPGKKTFNILTDFLCREGKLDEMRELLIASLDHNIKPIPSVYDKFIAAHCRDGRVEDAYVIHGQLLQRMENEVPKRSTYVNLINGFNQTNRADISAQLLVDMQCKGYTAGRSMARSVIHRLFNLKNPGEHLKWLLQMQPKLSSRIYNLFIDGAGHAKQPALAREFYEMMKTSGIEPNRTSDILMLQSYLKSERISDALHFFDDVCHRREHMRKLYNALIVGLCKAGRADIALEYLRQMTRKELTPSNECYECLIQLLCTEGKYDTAIQIIDILPKVGRQLTSFSGNVLLMHALKGQGLYEAWVRSRNEGDGKPDVFMLGKLIGVFSGCIRFDTRIDNLEELIKQSFKPDIFTYNLLLKILSYRVRQVDELYEYLNRIMEKGYEPNEWSKKIIRQFSEGWKKNRGGIVR